ncbi:hypothetical protein PTTG_26030 [Puccinia triticina 1-1 BBBD Race 1]|uniref:FGGY_C domain-containing protein n=1 Tax=Puccinia triticina (isolate 1-1 / race 1 (BBBD)) TaxID=630390 RepID=A0A180GX15_PUCT1|nr:hypothetical protein PTTG_26030 [Puccinia triticina 1-1 BBBD Race 1]
MLPAQTPPSPDPRVPHLLQPRPRRPAQLLKVNGRMSASDTLLQLQADLVGVVVEHSEMKETTALGAGLLAGHTISLFG